MIRFLLAGLFAIFLFDHAEVNTGRAADIDDYYRGTTYTDQKGKKLRAVINPYTGRATFYDEKGNRIRNTGFKLTTTHADGSIYQDEYDATGKKVASKKAEAPKGKPKAVLSRPVQVPRKNGPAPYRPVEMPAVTETQLDKGIRLTDEGNYEQAEIELREALSAAEKNLPAGSPSLLTLYEHLGLVLVKQNKLSEAEPIVKQALSAREKASPPDAFAIALARLDLATLYTLQGNFTDAEPIYQKTLLELIQSAGPHHPEITTCVTGYADMLRRANRPADATALEAKLKQLQAVKPSVR